MDCEIHIGMSEMECPCPQWSKRMQDELAKLQADCLHLRVNTSEEGHHWCTDCGHVLLQRRGFMKHPIQQHTHKHEDEPPVDYTGLSGPELLDALGDDAEKWATAFLQMAVKLDYSTMDKGWLIGWFANAIEHSWVVRTHDPYVRKHRGKTAKA